jgi:biopolymer transport protein ExbD
MPQADVTPIMGVILVIIPMLLAATEFTKIALLDYLPPSESEEQGGGGGGGAGGNTENEQKLTLVANLRADGIQMSLFGNTRPGPNFYTIPMLGDKTYNWATFVDSLYSIKVNIVGNPVGIDSVLDESTNQWNTFKTYKYIDGRDLNITADGDLQFQNVVYAMDACRFKDITVNGKNEPFELFPNASLKTFQ